MLQVSNKEFSLVRDRVRVDKLGEKTVFSCKYLELNPTPFADMLDKNIAGETFQPQRGRFVKKSVPSEIGKLVYKRFHYRHSFRRKQRWFMDYRWQKAQGPSQFIRSTYAFSKGHTLVEPILAMWCPVGRFRQESLLVTRQVEGISLKDFFLDPGRTMEDKLRQVRQGLKALKALHDDGIAFGDAQTRHQILNDNGEIWWLDFDKMVITNPGYGKKDRDLRRFLSSSLVRFIQCGYDYEVAYETIFGKLEEVYPLPPLWRNILGCEVRRRIKRMFKRPGFQKHGQANF